MQVTTGHNNAKRHLLFRISCAVAAVIALATSALIWTYRGMELRDLREHDKEVHLRLGAAMAGQGGPLEASTAEQDLSYLISRSLFGAADSSASMYCPSSSTKPLATGGEKSSVQTNRGAVRVSALPWPTWLPDPLSSRSLGLRNKSSWPLRHKLLGACRLDIETSLDSEASRIYARSHQIAISSAVLEGLLLLCLLWIARRGDERMVESEKEQSAMESELFFLAHYDTLTHLPNRSLFWERLDAAITRAERLGKAVGLVLVDLRDFGKLNDEHGRTVGDKALAEAARRIQAAARSSDLVCRIGPDEFAVLLEDLDPERAAEASSLLAQSLARHFDEPWSSTCPVPVGCNCGGSLYPQHGSKSEDLLSCAAQASKLARDGNIHMLFAQPSDSTQA